MFRECLNVNGFYLKKRKVFTNVSSPIFLTSDTSDPLRDTLNPSTSVGMVFSFCAFFSATISSAKNSTSSFSATTKNISISPKVFHTQCFDVLQCLTNCLLAKISRLNNYHIVTISSSIKFNLMFKL